MPISLLHQVECLLGLSFFLSFFNFGRKILFPFQIFTTWVHECCHAVTALMMGGHSIRITIASNCSGLTHYKISSGRLRQGIIASAGYLGASFIGCSIFYLSVEAGRNSSLLSVRSLLIALCSWIGLSLVFWMRNFFGFLSVLILGAGFWALAYLHNDIYSKAVLIFLGIQTGLNSLFDIRVLFNLGKSKGQVTSDAHTLAKLFYLPHWFWAFLWLGLSLGMVYFTIRTKGWI